MNLQTVVNLRRLESAVVLVCMYLYSIEIEFRIMYISTGSGSTTGQEVPVVHPGLHDGTRVFDFVVGAVRICALRDTKWSVNVVGREVMN